MIRSLEFLALPPTDPRHPERGKGLEMELIIDHAYVRKLPKTPVVVAGGMFGSESFQERKHIHQKGDATQLYRTEAPVLRTPPRLALSLHLAVHLRPVSINC